MTHISLTHNDRERLHKIRCRWQKEQQLIRQKYKIPYNMIYTSKRCLTTPVSITSQAETLFQYKELTRKSDDLKAKTRRINKHHLNVKHNDSNIPPMYCSKCHLNLTECSCSNGLGHWWINAQNKSHLTDTKISKKSSINSNRERHVKFDSSSIDLLSIERTNSQKLKSKQFVLLNWNHRQSLIDFIRTTKHNKNLSNMTIEQLHEVITNDNNIHIFNSIIDLILSMNDEQRHYFLCHIYIDPSYYLTIPISQSQVLADNINLTQALHSIQTIATLLGVKIDRSIDQFLQEQISTKKSLIEKRKLILNKQSLFIASKIPYHTFRNTSVHAK